MKTHQRVRKVIEIKNPDSYTLQVISFQETKKSNTPYNRSICQKRKQLKQKNNTGGNTPVIK